MFNGAGQYFGRGIPCVEFAAEFGAVPCFVYPVFVGMKLIITSFILYPYQYQYSTGHAYGQAGDVQYGKAFVLPQIPERDLEIVPDHRLSFSASE